MRSAAIAGIALLAAGVAYADDAPALLEQYKCTLCHGDNEAKAGPAFSDIAKAHRGDPRAAATLAAIIRHGSRSGGPWHMPPHPEIPDAEMKVVVRYILSRPPSP